MNSRNTPQLLKDKVARDHSCDPGTLSENLLKDGHRDAEISYRCVYKEGLRTQGKKESKPQGQTTDPWKMTQTSWLRVQDVLGQHC